MFTLRLVLAVVVSTGFLLSSTHAQQDVAPVNAEAILRELDQLEAIQKQAIESSRNSAVSEIKSAASSTSAAKSLYQKAVEELQFAGVTGKGAAFADWKSSMSDVLRNKEIQTALQLHLNYLVLSLERGASDQPERFVAPSLAYAKELAGADKSFIDLKENLPDASKKDPSLKQVAKLCDELLNKPLTESPFVKWLRLTPWLPNRDWEIVPGNLAGILEKNVRSEMRKAADPRLVGTWDIEMQIEAARAAVGGREHVATGFQAIKAPKLRFTRAQDMAVVGQPNRAVTEIYAVAMEFPQHPDFGKWVAELRKMLTPPAAAAPTAQP